MTGRGPFLGRLSANLGGLKTLCTSRVLPPACPHAAVAQIRSASSAPTLLLDLQLRPEHFLVTKAGPVLSFKELRHHSRCGQVVGYRLNPGPRF